MKTIPLLLLSLGLLPCAATIPTQAPTQAPIETPVDPAGDNTFMVMALVMLSMTALVVMVSKKRAF